MADGTARRGADCIRWRGERGLGTLVKRYVPILSAFDVDISEAVEGFRSEDVKFAWSELWAFYSSVSQWARTLDREGHKGRERKRVDVVTKVDQAKRRAF